MNILISDKLAVFVGAVKNKVFLMTCAVSVDLSAIIMSSCIQSCGVSTGCDLMSADRHRHSFILCTAHLCFLSHASTLIYFVLASMIHTCIRITESMQYLDKTFILHA